jgi:ABC-type dipeptide/oligopeptide/nickel transport system permease subunit
VNTVLALAVVGWTKYARLGRSLTLKLVQSEFIQAAVTNGTKPFALLHRHIVPNIMQMVIVTGAMDIGSMIMEIAGLSFLGFGAQPPTAEWGLMLNEGRQVMQMAPWAMIFPGLAILFVVSSFNLWGDSLRDLMDPSRSH